MYSVKRVILMKAIRVSTNGTESQHLVPDTPKIMTQQLATDTLKTIVQ
jgi:hypothetical protein